MKKVRVSAPGKLILFGEHSVVYGHHCIVTSVNKRVYLEAELNDQKMIWLNFKKPLQFKTSIKISDLTKNASRQTEYIEFAINEFFKKYKVKSGINITTYSDFNTQIGLGSSSAITVCTFRALSDLFNLQLTNEELFNLAFQTVIKIKGVGSGADLASAIWGGTIYYKTGEKVETLKMSKLPVSVVYTGIKADTPTIIKRVKDEYDNSPKIYKNIFNQIEKITIDARTALHNNSWKKLSKLMNLNQELLKSLGVSGKEIEEILDIIKKNGGLGGKLSGAGVGDCVLYYAEDKFKSKIGNKLSRLGYKVLNLDLSVEGLNYEKIK